MKKNGFTLVELMVVIVIIGVLAAVAVLNFQQACYKAECQTAMDSAGINVEAIPTAEFNAVFNQLWGNESPYSYQLTKEQVVDSMIARFSTDTPTEAPVVEAKPVKAVVTADTLAVLSEMPTEVTLDSPESFYNEIAPDVIMFTTKNAGQLSVAIKHYQENNSNDVIKSVEQVNGNVLITFGY